MSFNVSKELVTLLPIDFIKMCATCASHIALLIRLLYPADIQSPAQPGAREAQQMRNLDRLYVYNHRPKTLSDWFTRFSTIREIVSLIELDVSFHKLSSLPYFRTLARWPAISAELLRRRRQSLLPQSFANLASLRVRHLPERCYPTSRSRASSQNTRTSALTTTLSTTSPASSSP
ncbi:hypothetical protein BC938DRAFT_478453 [Jimgerdemannia flammicorona]|uniref:Uncharacterized protein n=1 Tax=Jimgerdemannia flammicorona TaxID=994334 RepID=A0A433QMU2_9FUNG|nr:hypothetical protein BC938DRAFT_478453 [Jimgerdemannia flammicorona]